MHIMKNKNKKKNKKIVDYYNLNKFWLFLFLKKYKKLNIIRENIKY